MYVWRSSLSRVMVPFKKLHNKYTVIRPFGAIIGSFNESNELQGVNVKCVFSLENGKLDRNSPTTLEG